MNEYRFKTKGSDISTEVYIVVYQHLKSLPTYMGNDQAIKFCLYSVVLVVYVPRFRDS